jgi:hypothetical protein
MNTNPFRNCCFFVITAVFSTCCLAAVASQSATQTAAAPSQPTTIRDTTYLGRAALRLSNGSLEAVVVPSLGRVMHFAPVGGENVLWTNAAPRVPPAGAPFWLNWGGDKTWLAPQYMWNQGKGWPPSPAWDGEAHTVEVLPNRLRLTSGVWPEFGVRLTREYSFDAAGDFVVSQTVEKVRGEARMLSIWSVTQVPPAEAVFLPTNPHSAYKNNFHWIAPAKDTDAVVQSTAGLLLARPSTLGSYKIGSDAPVASVASVNHGVAFVLRAATPNVKAAKNQYPDGAPGASFPVELFDSGPLPKRYLELEIFLAAASVFYGKSLDVFRALEPASAEFERCHLAAVARRSKRFVVEVGELQSSTEFMPLLSFCGCVQCGLAYNQ